MHTDPNTTDRGRLATVADMLLVLAFLGGLLLPGGGLLLGYGDRDDVASENRTAAPFPEQPVTLAAWPAAFASWFDDSVALRTQLVRAHNALLLLALDSSPSDRVTLGKDHWMFIGGDEYLDNYRNVDPLEPDELAAWRQVLDGRLEWAVSLGAEYVLLIAPSKSSVYPEQMADRFDRVRGFSRLDQLIADLAEHAPTVPVLDVRSMLVSAASRKLLYYPMGNHWTGPGAHVAYGELMRYLQPRVPGLGPPRPRVDFREVPHDPRGDNWAVRLHVGDLITQDTSALQPIRPPRARCATGAAAGLPDRIARWTQDDSTMPRGVLLHDSFGEALMPMLAEHFSELVTIPYRYMDATRVRQLVDELRPDVVIEEIVEYAFVRGPPLELPPGAPPDPGKTDRLDADR